MLKDQCLQAQRMRLQISRGTPAQHKSQVVTDEGNTDEFCCADTVEDILAILTFLLTG
jgi:hypothetical protein